MITVIIPMWNSARYIARSIESVLKQTYRDIELILIDDGSTDSTLQIVHSYLYDNRVRLYSKKNGGVSSARNYGIERANGDYVLFLDSDDWLAETTCEILLNTIEGKKADCVVFGFNQTHGHVWAPEFEKDYFSLESLKYDFDYWLNTELLSSSVNKLYKRTLLNSSFPPSMSFGEDLVFSLNYLSQCEKVCFIQEPLYQHEVYNVSSITHSFNIRRLLDLELAQLSIIQFAKEVTKETNKKYCSDVINSVKALFRQREITYIKKLRLLQEWDKQSYFKSLCLKEYNWPVTYYLYARMIQLKQWGLLGILHGVNNIIKGRL